MFEKLPPHCVPGSRGANERARGRIHVPQVSIVNHLGTAHFCLHHQFARRGTPFNRRMFRTGVTSPRFSTNSFARLPCLVHHLLPCLVHHLFLTRPRHNCSKIHESRTSANSLSPPEGDAMAALEDFPVLTVEKETITAKWSGEGDQVHGRFGGRRACLHRFLANLRGLRVHTHTR